MDDLRQTAYTKFLGDSSVERDHAFLRDVRATYARLFGVLLCVSFESLRGRIDEEHR